MAARPPSAQRPYLLRAMHEWMTDNALTPHIVVNASAEGVNVPTEHIQDGKVILNVSYAATRGLVMGNDAVAFEARFSGVPRAISVPVDAVLGIYARESGQGMVFAEEEQPPPDRPSPDQPPPNEPGPATPEPGGKRPTLKVVK